MRPRLDVSVETATWSYWASVFLSLVNRVKQVQPYGEIVIDGPAVMLDGDTYYRENDGVSSKDDILVVSKGPYPDWEVRLEAAQRNNPFPLSGYDLRDEIFLVLFKLKFIEEIEYLDYKRFSEKEDKKKELAALYRKEDSLRDEIRELEDSI